MEEEKYCKDCLYYKESAKPILRQPISEDKYVDMDIESICKIHKRQYSSDRKWHPVNSQCFKPKE